jgi:hypothetical protein
MPKKFFLLMLALLSLVAFSACGDDDEPATTTTNAAPAGGTTTEDSGGGGGGAAPANVEQAIEACKSSIDAQAQVSDDVKNDLKEICDKAASGDEQDVKEATREVCTKIIEESVPEGAARDQALETCKTATE